MRRFGPWLGAAFLLAGAVTLIGRRRFIRVGVSGHSMAPALRDGDWLIVDKWAHVVPGDVVLVRDPRSVGRLIVKRVRDLSTDAQVLLVSDHPAHAGELIGPVPTTAVVGRVRVRYWPAHAIGRLP
jgi:phage repressor protein C with HTH and peptisase S24 domain